MEIDSYTEYCIVELSSAALNFNIISTNSNWVMLYRYVNDCGTFMGVDGNSHPYRDHWDCRTNYKVGDRVTKTVLMFSTCGTVTTCGRWLFNL